MKKFALVFGLFCALVFNGVLYAQVPQKFNYQGIARDVKGNPLSGQTLGVKLTLLSTTDAVEGEYEEVQTVTTNAFGLYLSLIHI